jgi:hypothetical protein
MTPSPPDAPRRGQALVLPPALFFAALLQILLHYLLWSPLSSASLESPAHCSSCGFRTVSADLQFKRVNTPVHPFDTPRVLVTGRFSFTRNLMCLACSASSSGVTPRVGNGARSSFLRLRLR